MNFHKMVDLDLSGKKVLIREDYNVPIKNNIIRSDARLQASIDTIKLALKKGAAVIIASHLGRPTEGKFDKSNSLTAVSMWLSKRLDQEVSLVRNYLDSNLSVKAGQVVLLENVRFNVGEKNCDSKLSQQMAELCDVFVMDAFGTAHRAQASTYGVAKYAKIACAGPLLVKEIENLEKSLSEAKKPLLAIVGGAKVSSKLELLDQLIKKVDILIIGGGIANTFLAAKGNNIGKSICEENLIPVAQKILRKAKQNNTIIPMIEDVGVGKKFDENSSCEIKDVEDIKDNDMIFDIGPKTVETYVKFIREANTIIWNGPVGVFEFSAFTGGTMALSNAIAESDAFSVAGGGDTIAAIQKFNIADKLSYITTGGGAFLEYIEGKKLPAIAILEERFNS